MFLHRNPTIDGWYWVRLSNWSKQAPSRTVYVSIHEGVAEVADRSPMDMVRNIHISIGWKQWVDYITGNNRSVVVLIDGPIREPERPYPVFVEEPTKDKP